MRRFLNHGGWLALLFLLFGLGGGVWSYVSAAQSARFDRDGITILADVVDRRERRRRNNQGGTRTYHYVTVAYLVPGEDVTREVEQQVSENFHDDTRVGDAIPLRFLPDAPDRVELEPGRLGRTAWIAGIAGAVMGGFGLWIGAGVRRSLQRADRLAQAGVATVGRVLDARVRKNSLVLTWTYHAPLGPQQQITTRLPATSPLSALPAGAEFPARFDPDDPGNAAPADAALAR